MIRKLSSLTLLVSLVALSSLEILMIVLGSLEFQLQMHPVHKIFAILLTISGIVHLYLNFGAIKKYLGTKKLALYSDLLTVWRIVFYTAGIDVNKVQEIEKPWKLWKIKTH